MSNIMDKLNMKTTNIVDENIKRNGELYDCRRRACQSDQKNRSVNR